MALGAQGRAECFGQTVAAGPTLPTGSRTCPFIPAGPTGSHGTVS